MHAGLDFRPMAAASRSTERPRRSDHRRMLIVVLPKSQLVRYPRLAAHPSTRQIGTTGVEFI
jgi:hypothetical protein